MALHGGTTFSTQHSHQPAYTVLPERKMEKGKEAEREREGEGERNGGGNIRSDH